MSRMGGAPPICEICGKPNYEAYFKTTKYHRRCYIERRDQQRRVTSSAERWAIERWMREASTGVLDVEVD